MSEDYPGFKAAMCYFPVFGFLYSFLVFIKGDEPKPVKFHAAQCLLIGTGFMVSMVALMFVVIIANALAGIAILEALGLIAFVLGYNAVLWAGFLMCFILMAKAYGGLFMAPLVGQAAEEFSG